MANLSACHQTPEVQDLRPGLGLSLDAARPAEFTAWMFGLEHNGERSRL
jgi:hypothetical protein